MNPFSLGDAQLSCRVPLDSQLLLGATLPWFQLLLGAPVPQPQFPVPHLLPSEDRLHLSILFVPVASPCVFHSLADMHGQGCDSSRLSKQPCHAAVSEIWLQDGGVCSGLL